MDLSSAYLNIKLEKLVNNTKSSSTLKTPYLPFGLQTSPSVWKKYFSVLQSDPHSVTYATDVVHEPHFIHFHQGNSSCGEKSVRPVPGPDRPPIAGADEMAIGRRSSPAIRGRSGPGTGLTFFHHRNCHIYAGAIIFSFPACIPVAARLVARPLLHHSCICSSCGESTSEKNCVRRARSRSPADRRCG